MNTQIIKRGLYNCFLSIWFFMNPDAKERYRKHQEQMELQRIRAKAQSNYLQYVESFGKARQMGDRMLISPDVAKTASERFFLNDTLLDIEVSEVGLLSPEHVVTMLKDNLNKVTNRKMEVFQYTDTAADEMNPWTQYHRV